MTARRKKPAPAFTSIEQEAAFWDTHDTTDYETEWTPVKVRFAKNLSQGITIRFSPAALTKLRATAHERGVGPTTLARMWVLERLREDTSLAGSPSRSRARKDTTTKLA